MRVIGAGVFVFGGVLALVAMLGSLDIFEHAPAWVAGPGVAAFMLALVAVAQWLFNTKGTDPLGGKSAEEHLRELEQRGLLESTDFRAVRAFGVQEFEDEGLHYFLELTDGRVLFLSGQYLYDYEPIADDPEMNQPRAFPCSEFTVRRHKKEGYVAEIRCGGSVLEPEVIARPFGRKDWSAGRIPEDGALIVSATYDALKRERVGAAGEQRDAADEARR